MTLSCGTAKYEQSHTSDKLYIYSFSVATSIPRKGLSKYRKIPHKDTTAGK
jgi:hypothetical protein